MMMPQLIDLKQISRLKYLGKLKKNSKKVRIEFFFDNADFINEWLLQFGASLKIESPQELIEKKKSTSSKNDEIKKQTRSESAKI